MLRKLGLVAALGTTVAFAPAHANTLNMIVSWPESNTMAYLPGKQLKENLEAMVTGLEISISGPETVPPFEQLGPTSVGVFDLIYTHPAYHDRAITNVTNILKPDMAGIRASGIFDYMDEYMQENHNLKLLANVAIGTAGYHCYLREPLSENGDWSGRRIRGVATYVPVIEALGGAAMTTDMAEVYSALERGVVDGACAPQSVLRATRHFEVAPYRTEPTFGQLVSYIAINLDSWNSLTDEQRAALTEAAIKTEQDTIRLGNEAIEADLEAMAEAGVEVTEIPEAQYQILLEAYGQGVWDLVETCCGAEAVEDLRTLATENNLMQ